SQASLEPTVRLDHAVHSEGVRAKRSQIVVHHRLENVKPMGVELHALCPGRFISIGIPSHFRPSTCDFLVGLPIGRDDSFALVAISAAALL
ncbi:TPA: hypothetical protein ACWV9B_006093, partial [Pseudomonas aeruginosa]